MTDAPILQRLRQVACAALNLNLAPDEAAALSRLDEVAGLDSLTVLNLVSAVEKEFGVTLEPADLSIGVLADLPRLASRIASLGRKPC